MSDRNIKVTPAELEARANEFRNVMNQTNTLTADMMKTIMGLSSVWTGSSSEEYISQFKGLQKDMDKMGELINDHVTDLLETAKRYSAAEKSNISAIGGLPANALS